MFTVISMVQYSIHLHVCYIYSYLHDTRTLTTHGIQ